MALSRQEDKALLESKLNSSMGVYSYFLQYKNPPFLKKMGFSFQNGTMIFSII